MIVEFSNYILQAITLTINCIKKLLISFSTHSLQNTESNFLRIFIKLIVNNLEIIRNFHLFREHQISFNISI